MRRSQRKETELAIFVTPVVVAQDKADMKERVARGRAVLDHAFPEAPTLGTAVPEQRPVTWDPYAGEGSQWQPLPAPDSHPLSEQDSDARN